MLRFNYIHTTLPAIKYMAIHCIYLSEYFLQDCKTIFTAIIFFATETTEDNPSDDRSNIYFFLLRQDDKNSVVFLHLIFCTSLIQMIIKLRVVVLFPRMRCIVLCGWFWSAWCCHQWAYCGLPGVAISGRSVGCLVLPSVDGMWAAWCCHQWA